MAEEQREKRNIRLTIRNTNIAVKVYPEEEELYRRAGKLINETVNTYAQLFRGRKSDTEVLYMALIDIALHYEREAQRNDTVPISDVLVKLTAEVEEALGVNNVK